ncbi:Serine/threonine-protein kinase EDR1 [Acorus calamus]|uniref:non-specific serine/threonine protein kinase n=1 Tax=Acorus calamus TaxID=4465 RepID=A0AAV9CGF7_ACOCL|nr:Serine/threonine-protein kinase EDR1 [Acorus calamus]
MKHIFKKLHFPNNNRSNDPSISSSSPATAASSCAAAAAEASAAMATSPSGHQPPPSPSRPLPSPTLAAPAADSSGGGGGGEDYFTSEEEFQVQLALAISASNTDFRDDPHNDQIRAATLLSLGKHKINPEREEESIAESLSRRYWDYSVLDYDEKVVDGFYDIFKLSTDPTSQGKMPTFMDLQTSIGDLGYEVIIVNRAIDPPLVELEQVAQCFALDCLPTNVVLLVQRISELITDHMGGRVGDAEDMMAKWIAKSTELRTSRQTSLLPIGCFDTGLSRHRALLFKVLADNVGIPCKLIKGNHYTGVEEDAVNIVKLEDREFLVDLMGAPGTLIPSDILSRMDSQLNSYNPRLGKSYTSRGGSDTGVDLNIIGSLQGAGKSDAEMFTSENSGMYDRKLRSENSVFGPSFPSTSSGMLPSIAESSSKGSMIFPVDRSNQFPSSSSSASSSKGVSDVSTDVNWVHEKLNAVPYSQNTTDSRDPFADLDPFRITGFGKPSSQSKVAVNKVNDFQRPKDNIVSGPGRPPLPLVWKNRSVCNEDPNIKQNNVVGGSVLKKNVGVRDPKMTSSSSGFERVHTGIHHANVAEGSSYSAARHTLDNDTNRNASGNFGGFPSGRQGSMVPLRTKQMTGHLSDNSDAQVDRPSMPNPFSENKNMEEDHGHGIVNRNNAVYEVTEHRQNLDDKRDRRKLMYDRFMEGDSVLMDQGNQNMQIYGSSSRLDPMLVEVAEWEIPWGDLILGERIGLGSYGEVYHADWNGTEVAVKKFLDQDFSGDALDEFRSEVRIMRRLRHPNVVLFMGAVTRPPNLSIVTEFLPRGSLFRILHRPNFQLDEKRRIKMALDVAKGMNCLHTSTPTIVHRDLKSPNLLVDKNWNVKVCDFGLSRLKHNTFLSSKSTAGTPEWMAPEVLRNEQSNEKCDVYSFGIILWELATLRMPWSGMNPMQVVGAVGFQNKRLDIPKEVDPLVARIIWECWQTDPNLRPSFSQLTSALKPLQQLVIPNYQDVQSPPRQQEIPVNVTP